MRLRCLGYSLGLGVVMVAGGVGPSTAVFAQDGLPKTCMAVRYPGSHG